MSFSLYKIDQLKFRGNGSIVAARALSDNNLNLGGVTMNYGWYDSYRTAVLETDWTKMRDRIQSAECKIHDRQRELSADHDGTPQERQAIINALSGMRTLRTEVTDWQTGQVPQAGDAKTTSEIALRS